MIQTWHQVLDQSLLRQLEKDISTLPSAKLQTDCRGEHYAHFLGDWRPRGGRYYNNVYETPATKTEAGKQFIIKYKPLWKNISRLLRTAFPGLVVFLRKVPKKHRKFGLLSLLILNETNIQSDHTDAQDWHNGVCIVFGLGDGRATLEFPLQNAIVQLRRGDLCAFRSSLLLHGLQEVEGERMSGVLTTHNNLISKFNI